jgi:preprotein translocase subunit SecG
MQTIVIVIHLMIVVALVGVVLLQRSEGGGLGIGGGSGFMTARGAANALTRTTAILAAAFFVTSLALSLIARYGDKPIDILDRLPANTQQEQGTGGNGILDQLGGDNSPPSENQQAPAAPAPAETGNNAAPSTQTAPSGGDTQTAPAQGTTDQAPATDNGSTEEPTPTTPESQVPTGQ